MYSNLGVFIFLKIEANKFACLKITRVPMRMIYCSEGIMDS